MNILFFSPNQGIWPFSYPESLIANSLKLQGHKVIYLNCEKLFNKFCLTHNALQLRFEATNDEKDRICKECISKKNILSKTFGFENYLLNDYVSQNAIQKIENDLNKLTIQECLDFKIGEFPVGRKALYEFLINHKKSTLDLNEIEFAEYKNGLGNCLVAYQAITNFSNKMKVDKVLMFNTLYSVNAVATEIFEKQKIDVYTMHAGLNLSDRYQKLLMGKESTAVFLRKIRSMWSSFKNIPINQDEADYVTKHFIELVKGENHYAFSTEKKKIFFDVRKKFNIEKNKKIVVALMSSYDEQFASLQVDSSKYNMIFPSQIEWIKELITYFKQHPDLYLIIRVHPREFPRKLSVVLSEHAIKLKKEFESLPPNIKINWPVDDVSLYDLMEETELFLSAWSSAGKEMSFFGKPVILYSDDYIFYPHELNIYRNNREDYFKAIDENLNKNFDFERIRQGFRWYAFDQSKAMIDLSDLCTIHENKDKNIVRRIFKKVLKITNKDLVTRFDLWNKNRKLKSISLIEEMLKQSLDTPIPLYKQSKDLSIESESIFIKASLRKIYKAMYGSVQFDKQYPENSLRKRLFEQI